MTRRGNPNWGRPIPLGTALATEFELQITQLRLTPENLVFSDELHMVQAEQEPMLHPRMAPWCLGYPRRSRPQRRV